jgi:hypothetical protein
VIGQLSPVRRWLEEQVTDPRGRPFKTLAPILCLLVFGGQLTYHRHAEGVIGRAPKHRLHSCSHHYPKRGKLSGHFGMVKGRNPHLLRLVMPHPRGTDDGMTQLGTLGL